MVDDKLVFRLAELDGADFSVLMDRVLTARARPRITVDQLRAMRAVLPDEGLFFCRRAFVLTGSVEAAIELLRAERASET